MSFGVPTIYAVYRRYGVINYIYRILEASEEKLRTRINKGQYSV